MTEASTWYRPGGQRSAKRAGQEEVGGGNGGARGRWCTNCSCGTHNPESTSLATSRTYTVLFAHSGREGGGNRNCQVRNPSPQIESSFLGASWEIPEYLPLANPYLDILESVILTKFFIGSWCYNVSSV